VFVIVFALMLAVVVAITMSAAKSKGHAPTAGGRGTATPSLPGGVTGQQGSAAKAGAAVQTTAGAMPETIAPAPQLDRALSAALTGVVRGSGRLAVGVIDETSGTEAVFRAGRSFRAAGLAATDLAAALLLLHQQAGQAVSSAESAQATAMIETGSGASTTAMWKRLHDSLPAANVTLKLRHTRGGTWRGLTSTVADQLQLLSDLSVTGSPLNSSGRDYLLGLMTTVAPGQRWGVPAAASAGTSYAVKDGSLPVAGRWAVSSTGVIERGGQELLIAVLSAGSPSQATGEALVQAAALAAANTITRSS
jgi:hypothetical protein